MMKKFHKKRFTADAVQCAIMLGNPLFCHFHKTKYAVKTVPLKDGTIAHVCRECFAGLTGNEKCSGS
ncbi:hypothetical protein M0R72_17460 [Candidatus Pacearchaeota archaeon]|jgi:hypothetical protein|nr:hypothetical protein [Candidatus Pacearchaeota archaeon]